MDVSKKHRSILRRSVTLLATELDKLMSATPHDKQQIQVTYGLVQVKMEELRVADERVYEALLQSEAIEDDLLADMTTSDSYKIKFAALKLQVEDLFREVTQRTDHFVDAHSELSIAGITGRRRFKLPIIEFKKFDGDIRNWLPFWSQFKKIHEATDIEAVDKIYYLIQATIPSSRARQLVESYPSTEENYPHIIEAMISRFGRDDLQIEVYVRELLKLILCNATSQLKLELVVLYDKIETQVRALDTLGITSDKCSAMLFPLIESCLPQDLLRAWQRSSQRLESENLENSTSSSDSSKLDTRLKNLMKFLKAEVENEQRIALASEGFGLVGQGNGERTKSKIVSEFSDKKKASSAVPTAANLVNVSSFNCAFCDGVNHTSENCFKAQKMSLEQKKGILTSKKLCFRCLKAGHITKKCRGHPRCIFCQKSHMILMCPDLPSNKESLDNSKKPVMDVDKSIAAYNNTKPQTHVFLQTLRVNVIGTNGSRFVRVLIDSGSQRSYILKSTAKELGCQPISKEKLIHCLFGGSQNQQIHECYEVKLEHQGYSYNIKVLDQLRICSEVLPVFSGPWIEELRSLNIELSDFRILGPIEILIGADFVGQIYTGNRQMLSNSLIAYETFFGWVLLGKIPVDHNFNLTNSLINLSLTLLAKDSITSLWDLDILGIEEPNQYRTREELVLAAKESFIETVTVNNEGRYEVRLPWIEGHPPLSTNYYLARKRFQTTLQKLQSQHLVRSYSQVFKEWLEEEIIEIIPSEHDQNGVHYLPHRPVIKENSLTTKIRPVFDASAHEKDQSSLNNCLEKGQNFIELIPSILLKFREYKFGVISDIRKAFLQISLHETDRDFLRFIWIDEDGNELTFRHCRVVFGVSSSPFLLGATIEHHLKEILRRNENGENRYSRQVILKLANKGFYVDNCVTSVSDEIALKMFIQEASMIMAEGKFDLRGWEFTRDHNNINAEVVPLSVLGLNWDSVRDMLTINSNCIKDDLQGKTITKRLILSIAQRIFDPIGFVCPATLIPKLLLQELWKKNLTWDETVGEETAVKFKNWFAELSSLLKIAIPRWVMIVISFNLEISMHTFCDASKTAYSAVVFLRVVKDTQVSVHLLAAKSRVAPTHKKGKVLTIPRLELLAATIGSRLFRSVVDNLETKPVSCYFWSDSSTVISWIERKEEWATFVWNRIDEIRRLTPSDAWRHIPGIHNPADLPSRGCSPKFLLQSRWWEGPAWLYEETWPNEPFNCNEEEVYSERKKKLVTSMVNNSNSDFWHLTVFSEYFQTIKLIAAVFRFVFNMKNNKLDRKYGLFDYEELNYAEIFILKIVQEESFPEKENDKSIKSLQPFRDEHGLIRLKSSISSRNDSENFRFPIILPAKHPTVYQIIFQEHVRACHVGTQGLLSILRERYWILGGRRTIRSVISKCITCRRYDAKHLTVNSPPLPIDRVRDANVFEVTGVDFAGPLFLTNGDKAYICIFTCAVYRAVLLELTTSLSTNSFSLALRRFVARRNQPKTIYSDNGTNFVGLENAFGKIDWTNISEHCSSQRINWRFNPPTASWWGGFWERLIGVVKKLLRKVLGRASLDYEDLLTLVCECEAVINNRPITYISSDSTDLVALTPSMFLNDVNNEYGMPDCDEIDRKSLCRKMRHKQKLRDDLRRRFRIEYLGQLKIDSKKMSRSILLGEIVLVGDDNRKRLDWLTGCVTELIPGKDGVVRLVRIKTRNGQILRPVQKLYPLECLDDEVSVKQRIKDIPKESKEEELRCVPGSEEDRAGVIKSRASDNDSDQFSCSSEVIKSRASYNDSDQFSCSSEVFKSRAPDSVVKTRSGRISRKPHRFGA